MQQIARPDQYSRGLVWMCELMFDINCLFFDAKWNFIVRKHLSDEIPLSLDVTVTDDTKAQLVKLEISNLRCMFQMFHCTLLVTSWLNYFWIRMQLETNSPRVLNMALKIVFSLVVWWSITSSCHGCLGPDGSGQIRSRRGLQYFSMLNVYLCLMNLKHLQLLHRVNKDSCTTWCAGGIKRGRFFGRP